MPGPDKRNPCKGCPDRKTGERDSDCHTGCKDYADYRKNVTAEKTFLMQKMNGHICPPTVKYKKSSGAWVPPKGINHKKVR